MRLTRIPMLTLIDIATRKYVPKIGEKGVRMKRSSERHKQRQGFFFLTLRQPTLSVHYASEGLSQACPSRLFIINRSVVRLTNFLKIHFEYNGPLYSTTLHTYQRSFSLSIHLTVSHRVFFSHCMDMRVFRCHIHGSIHE